MPRVKPIFAWYDLWVGVFIDRPKRRIYVFPVPCFGLVIQLGERDPFNPYPIRQWVDDQLERLYYAIKGSHD